MNLHGRRVAVTGATGMLGRYIVRALRHAGADVRAVVRSPGKGEDLEAMGVGLHRADLAERDALAAGFANCDAVVHSAALYRIAPRGWDAFYAANVVGTENVLAALEDAGVGRLIHVSTFGVYRFRLYEPIDESRARIDGTRREGGAYRATKSLSEDRCWDAAEKGLALTVLRPTGIYGAHDPNLLPLVRRLVRLPVTPAPTLRFPLVYAADVAEAAVAALGTDLAVGKAYNTGGSDASFSEFLRALARVDPSSRGFVLPLPVPLVVRADSRRAGRELGFSNRSFEEGLRETLAES